MSVVFWGSIALVARELRAVDERLPPLVGVVFFLVFTVVFTAVAPHLGFRRFAALLLPVPILGTITVVQAVWRAGSLPRRYWEGTMFPSRLSPVWLGLVVVGVTIGGFSSLDAVRRGWVHDSREIAIAKYVRDRTTSRGDVRERRILMTMRRGVRTFVVERWITPGGSVLNSFWVARSAEGRWEIDDLSGTEVACYIATPDAHCLLEVHPDATSIQALFVNRSPVYASATQGAAVVWLPPDAQGGTFNEWRSFDQSGRELERRRV